MSGGKARHSQVAATTQQGQTESQHNILRQEKWEMRKDGRDRGLITKLGLMGERERAKHRHNETHEIIFMNSWKPRR